MQKHYVHITNEKKSKLHGYLPVNAHIIKVDGNNYIVHRNFVGGYSKKGNYLGVRGKYFIVADGWRISHLETGILAYSNYGTKKLALEEFPDYLKNVVGKSKTMDDYIKEAKEDHGLTPEFDKSKEHLILKDKLLKK
jgi:hypothetical protein